MFKHPILLSPSILILLFAQALAQDWQWARDEQLINPSGAQSFGSGKVDLGDIDGDSWLDLVVLDSVGLRFYRNRGLQGSIGFERRPDWETVLPPALWEYAVPTLADLNDDGRADLIIPDNQTNSFRYWQNTGDVSGNFWTRADSVFQGVVGNQFIALAISTMTGISTLSRAVISSEESIGTSVIHKDQTGNLFLSHSLSILAVFNPTTSVSRISMEIAAPTFLWVSTGRLRTLL